MNMASGLRPSQMNGRVITPMILPYLGWALPKMSTMYVMNVSDRPVMAVVRKTKLIVHIFLFKGINKVSGYTKAPSINEVRIQSASILDVLPLLSIMMRQK